MPEQKSFWREVRWCANPAIDSRWVSRTNRILPCGFGKRGNPDMSYPIGLPRTFVQVQFNLSEALSSAGISIWNSFDSFNTPMYSATPKELNTAYRTQHPENGTHGLQSHCTSALRSKESSTDTMKLRLLTNCLNDFSSEKEWCDGSQITVYSNMRKLQLKATLKATIKRAFTCTSLL